MNVLSDNHMHSRNSCDCRAGGHGSSITDLAAALADAGVSGGVTDHHHTPLNTPDIEASRREFDESGLAGRMRFGVEASCVSRWELDRIAAGEVDADKATYGVRSGGPEGTEEFAVALTDEETERFGVEYVVAGAHWPMYLPADRERIIRNYHAQNMFLAAHPIVDIVAHPWWWMGYWKNSEGLYLSDPWLDDFGKIPRSMHDEFAACLVEHETAVEANWHACIVNRSYPDSFAEEYLDYLGYLHERGARISFGSDAHNADHIRDCDHDRARDMLASVGVRPSDLYRPGY